MFSGHIWELVPLLLIAVIFLGPKRLPDAGKSLGKAIRGFREETKGFHEELAPLKDEVHSIHSEVAGVRDSITSSVKQTTVRVAAVPPVEPVVTKP